MQGKHLASWASMLAKCFPCVNFFLIYFFNDLLETNLNYLRVLYLKQEALLLQRNRATRMSVEILQLQHIPIVWHYLCDPTFSRFYTIPECDRHTHRDDGQIHDDGM